MQGNKINILSTRPVSATITDEAKAKGIIIESLSFIATEPIENVEVQQEVEQAFLLSTTVIFTSMNAVEAVAAQLEDQQPDWNIYTMGHTTMELVKKFFGEDRITGTASSAAELAELIVEDGTVQEVIFFCGDQRRDELPDILQSNEIDVQEIEVYSTVATPHKLTKQYEGILFFSPSAVKSFFSVNKLSSNTILFAIGDTTANAIKKYSTNKIIISDAPVKEDLVREMMEFFET